jgi:fucose 4-O-acetylase-like acetyltransferase
MQAILQNIYWRVCKDMAKERNWWFDYLKGIACIVVVLLHSPLPGIAGELVIYAFRFPVPIFFMISGYYSIRKSDGWICHKAGQLLKMLLLSECFYFIWYLVRCCLIEKQELTVAMCNITVFLHPIRTILCGSFFNGMLWYLYAIVWTYLLLILLRHFSLYRHCWFRVSLIVLLLGIQVIGRYHVQTCSDINKYIWFFRNALTFGLPLTMLGGEIAEHESFIRERLSLTGNLLIIFAGNLMIVVEYLVSGIYMDFHASTCIISIGMFLLAFTYRGEKMIWKSGICYIGREFSMWIYLLQSFFLTLLSEFPQNIWIENLQSIIVLGCSVLGAFLCRKLCGMIGHYIENRKGNLYV